MICLENWGMAVIAVYDVGTDVDGWIYAPLELAMRSPESGLT